MITLAPGICDHIKRLSLYHKSVAMLKKRPGQHDLKTSFRKSRCNANVETFLSLSNFFCQHLFWVMNFEVAGQDIFTALVNMSSDLYLINPSKIIKYSERVFTK